MQLPFVALQPFRKFFRLKRFDSVLNPNITISIQLYRSFAPAGAACDRSRAFSTD